MTVPLGPRTASDDLRNPHMGAVALRPNSVKFPPMQRIFSGWGRGASILTSDSGITVPDVAMAVKSSRAWSKCSISRSMADLSLGGSAFTISLTSTTPVSVSIPGRPLLNSKSFILISSSRSKLGRCRL